MNSVLCSACVQKIQSENDRVYCFGGCDQILHVKCSDINTVGAKAMHDNVALKYMCHGCRKKMVCLTDIQRKCNNMSKQIETLAATVNELELKLTTSMMNKLDGFEKKITTNVVKALKIHFQPTSTSSEVTPTTLTEQSTSYAAVLVQNDSDDKANPRDLYPGIGGLLRSGKRRNLQVQQKGPSTMNTPVAPPRENLQTTAVSTAKKSPAVKSKLVTRIERSVAFKTN